MMIRKLLLFSLLTMAGMLAVHAQTIHVYGVVTNANGGVQEDVTINLSSFCADSSFYIESVQTGPDGAYDVTFPYPDTTILCFIQVDMIDCNNNIQTQVFTAITNISEFEANFTYCSQNMPDSCLVFILAEHNPGTTNYILTAWTPSIPGNEFSWSTGETTETIEVNQSGTYCVTVTNDSIGCMASDCEFINLDSNNFCFAYIISTPNGDSTYYLQVFATGVAPFTYSWSTGETTDHLDSVSVGTYCVVVTDSTGCIFTTCIIVDNVQFCGGFISEEPNGGLTANGQGLPPFVYVWNTGDSSQTIYPNAEGLFCVTITDANGCVASTCYNYWFPMDSCLVSIYPFFPDSNSFALEAIPSSAGMSFSYAWSTGDTTNIIYPLDPGETYCVTVTDNQGCVASTCFSASNWCYVWIDLDYIDSSNATLTAVTDPIFNWPGSPPPVYLWSNGDTTSAINATASGEYCVTVTLSSGCTTTACVNVDFESLGDNCSAWIFQYPDSTGNWLAEVYAWGEGDFTYNWSTGDTSSVIAIDPNTLACVTVTSSFGCESIACTDTINNPCFASVTVTYLNDSIAVLTASASNPGQLLDFQWSNGETGAVITVSQNGEYCVTVTGGGCISSSCINVYFSNVGNCGVVISQIDTLSGVLFYATPFGTPPFTYLWDNGSTEPFLWIDFGNLQHCVTVTDATGCVASACTYDPDSCSASIALSYVPNPHLVLMSYDPVTFVQWTTGNPGDTMLWLDITQPGTYCAIYTTIYNCTDSVCIQIDSLFPMNGANLIAGFVFGDTLTSLKGNVNAYVVNNNTGEPFLKVGSSPIGQSGYYAIPNMPQGLYVIKAEIESNTSTSEKFIPTYHLRSSGWEKADLVVIPNMLNVTTDIQLLRKTGMNGSGVIGGVITDPGHLTGGEGEEERGLGGLGNVEILLHDATGEPLDYNMSLEDGTYRFTGLPFGTYRIRYEIPGLTSPDVWVTLTPENPELLQVNIIVENGSVATHELSAEEIMLYPNPASHTVKMNMPSGENFMSVQIIDMQGRIAFSGNTKQDNGILSLDINSLAPGVYHVNLVGARKLYHGRFIKQE